MKRGGPLKRKTPLAQGEKTLKRTPLKRIAVLREPVKRNSFGKRWEPPAETVGEALWRSHKKGYCENPACIGREGRLVQHHVIYRQHVVDAKGDIWDPRNSMTLCERCHKWHHGPMRLAVKALPEAVFFFAVDLLGHGKAYEYISRHYPGGDERLDSLRLEWERG